MKQTRAVIVAAAVAGGVIGAITYIISRPHSAPNDTASPGSDQVTILQNEVAALEDAVSAEQAEQARLSALLATIQARLDQSRR